MITVGEIRKAIEGLGDDVPAVIVASYRGAEGALGAPPTMMQVNKIEVGNSGLFEIHIP